MDSFIDFQGGSLTNLGFILGLAYIIFLFVRHLISFVITLMENKEEMLKRLDSLEKTLEGYRDRLINTEEQLQAYKIKLSETERDLKELQEKYRILLSAAQKRINILKEQLEEMKIRAGDNASE